jgi:hypothetical protein
MALLSTQKIVRTGLAPSFTTSVTVAVIDAGAY